MNDKLYLLSVCGSISDRAHGDNHKPHPTPTYPTSWIHLLSIHLLTSCGYVQMDIDHCYMYALPMSMVLFLSFSGKRMCHTLTCCAATQQVVNLEKTHSTMINLATDRSLKSSGCRKPPYSLTCQNKNRSMGT